MFDPRDHWLIPEWPAPNGVHAIVSTREGGDASPRAPFGFNVGTRCGDDPAMVARNRAFLVDALALPAEPCWLRQVHGTRVVAFDRPRSRTPPPAGEGVRSPARAAADPRSVLAGGAGAAGSPLVPGVHRADDGNRAREPEADAAVTCASAVVLAIQTADCLPVLFCSDDGSETGAAHAGWRGLSAGVLEATVAALHVPRENLLAWLGPAIAAPSYEVGDEVRAAFVAHDPSAASAFTPTRPGHWTCDLYGLARQRLRAAGVARITGGGLDTFTDPRLHSYRRDRAYSGRMVSLIWRTP